MTVLTSKFGLLAGAILLAVGTAHGAEPFLSELDLFTGGRDGYHTFRIPALVITAKGTVLAFAEARRNSPSDHGDIDLVVKRSTDGGKTWGGMKVVHEEGGAADITIGNPCPVVDTRTGVVHLLFTRNNQRLFHTSSTDDGRTFTAPVEMTSILQGVPMTWTRVAAGPGHGIQLRGGRLLAPIWLNEKIRVNYRCGAVYSDDGGKTWKAGGIVGPEVKDTNECMMYERGDGSVVVNMRAQGSKKRSVAVSRDGGLTWSASAYLDQLVDPVCQGSILRVPGRKASDSGLTWFANPAAETRVNLTVRFSRDEGKSWSAGRAIYSGPSGYSDLAAAKDGTILCLFESGESRYSERLRLARFNAEWAGAGSENRK